MHPGSALDPGSAPDPRQIRYSPNSRFLDVQVAALVGRGRLGGLLVDGGGPILAEVSTNIVLVTEELSASELQLSSAEKSSGVKYDSDELCQGVGVGEGEQLWLRGWRRLWLKVTFFLGPCPASGVYVVSLQVTIFPTEVLIALHQF